MSSARRKGDRKLSRGILKSRTRDGEDDRRDDRGVKIYIRTNQNDEAPAPEIDQERFERLKDLYFKQCQPINMNLIRKLTDKRHSSGYNYNDNRCSGVNAGSSASRAMYDTNGTKVLPYSSQHDISNRARNGTKKEESRYRHYKKCYSHGLTGRRIWLPDC